MPYKPQVFRPPGARSRGEQKREHDSRRGSARQRGYDARWDAASKAFLRRNPLCVGCKVRGHIVAAVLTDHVVPHKGDPAKFWCIANWQPSCRWHHDVIKQRLERMYERGEIGADALWLDSAVAQRLAAEP